MPYQSITPEQFHTEIKRFHDNFQSSLPSFPEQSSNDFLPFITQLVLLTHDFTEFIDLHYEFALFAQTLLIFRALTTKINTYGPLPTVIIISRNSP
jgi:hypothetical protein